MRSPKRWRVRVSYPIQSERYRRRMSAFSRREGEVGLDDAPELLADVALPVDGGAHARDQIVHPLLEEAAEDRLLRREQLVERPDRQLRGPRDLHHRRLLVALARVEAPRGEQHVGAAPRALARLAPVRADGPRRGLRDRVRLDFTLTFTYCNVIHMEGKAGDDAPEPTPLRRRQPGRVGAALQPVAHRVSVMLGHVHGSARHRRGERRRCRTSRAASRPRPRRRPGCSRATSSRTRSCCR